MENNRDQDKLAGAAKTVVNQSFDSAEAAVDTAIESTIGSTKDIVHELRNEAAEAVDQTVGRVRESLDRQRPELERYITSHPWMTLAGLLILGYLFAGIQRSRNSV